MSPKALVFLALLAAASGLKLPQGDPVPAIKGLVSRILGENFVSMFEYEVISPDKGDVFEVDITNSSTSKPVLRGNNGVALASALNYYLKYTCNCSISWGRNGTGDQLNIPLPLPLPSFARVVSPVKYRYYQNVCTVSYSMVWWDFARWEREIDWMAMNGLNLILSFTGQEYVWQKFYRTLGLNDSAIKSFLSGAAFLAWQRMGNIQGWAGPLDDGWIESQAMLQKQIVARIRQFGMVNVLPGFAGHVPAGLVDLYPNATYVHTRSWNSFSSQYSDDYLLQPNNTLFGQIGQLFYKMLIAEYGSDHVFNCDTYNEMNPVSTNLTYLADTNRAIYATMAAVDKDAVFLMQGWLFQSSGFWTNDRIKAYLSEVPNDHMIILDLYSEQFPIWNRTESYYGKPFIWCLLHNFGGTRGIYGNLTTIATGPIEARNTKGSTMVGVGMTPEAIEHNPVVYDLMGEMSWRSEKVTDVPSWTMQYAARRYGKSELPQSVQQAWTYLLDGAYQYHWSGELRSMVDRHPELSLPYYSSLNASEIALAWQLLTAAAYKQEVNSTFGTVQYDIVDFGRQTLVNMFADVQRMYSAAYATFTQSKVNTTVTLAALSSVMMDILDDLETLLSSDTNFLLGHWIADARASIPTSSPSSAVDNAEFNARNQVTMWGPRENIEDYAAKDWSGLVKDYYKPRWSLFTDTINEAVRTGKEYDHNVYESELFELEKKFSYTIKSYPTQPTGDPVEISHQLSQKYLLTMDYISAHYDIIENMDAPGNDILGSTPAWNSVIIQSAWLCDVNPSCAGFNSNGFLKTMVASKKASAGTKLLVKKTSRKN